MKIVKVTVDDFRALEHVEVDTRFLTALVGPNGAGKSSWLHALGLFFGPAAGVDQTDVYAGEAGREIQITIEFDALDGDIAKLIPQYVRGGILRITRKIDVSEDKPRSTFHGWKGVNPDFQEMRELPASEGLKRYKAVRTTDTYADLPDEKTAMGRAKAHLDQWELDHPEVCSYDQDDGKFFGVDEKAVFNLSDHVKFLLIPAVRDASKDLSGSGTIPSLLAEEAASLVFDNPEVIEAINEVNQDLEELVRPEQNEKLTQIKDSINETIQGFTSNARIEVDWELEALSPPGLFPTVDVVEDSYRTTIQRAGHGVQRAIIIAVLQHQAAMNSAKSREGGMPVRRLILAIEEPELFQHPNRQRHFAEILRAIAGGDGRGVTEKTQVLIATHSPLFVNLHYFDCVRRLQKVEAVPGSPMVTTVAQAEPDAVAEKLWDLYGRPGEKFKAEHLRPRIQSIMTPWMNEGFFASKVVLVEGESDRAALSAYARARPDAVHLEELGISVIPCSGKANLDRPYLVFTEFGIPTLMMWDADKDDPDAADEKKKQRIKDSIRLNRRLLRLTGQTEEDFPSAVGANYIVHEHNLEVTLRTELGEDLYRESIAVAKEIFGYDRGEDVLKSPVAMEAFVSHALSNGGTLNFLENALQSILALNVARKYQPAPGGGLLAAGPAKA